MRRHRFGMTIDATPLLKDSQHAEHLEGRGAYHDEGISWSLVSAIILIVAWTTTFVFWPILRRRDGVGACFVPILRRLTSLNHLKGLMLLRT